MKRSLTLAAAAVAAGALVGVLAATRTDSSRPHRVGVAGNAGRIAALSRLPGSGSRT
jgi:hypothetical protein